ncbi:phosphatase PAP2 family protein [Gordonia otitidis]|uniref:phosphatase PAP2 family protein n=1 Tax=Gordonia otitidis TaxID=249058 RepID=UPI001D13898D|nr:phosphatase PAP2 family protein [Gordonia otitidis]UEA61067.1 phosphatase PAP2 family protein [Gordonia otitidis]
MAIAAICVGIATYLLAVRTTTGQRIENAALRGADHVSHGEYTEAGDALGQITVVSLAIATLIVLIVAALRRQLRVGVVAVAIIGGAQVVTQTLKRFVLTRPDLVDTSGPYAHNSLPSGHTTIAITVLFAIMLVVPYRVRGLAILIVTPWAISIGAYTITAKWHRFSDTLAADCVALAVACLVCLVAVRVGWLDVEGHASSVDPLGRGIIAALMALAFVVFAGLGIVLWAATWLGGGSTDTVEDNSYLGANMLAAAGSTGVALIFWWTLHKVSLTSPAREVVDHRTQLDHL